MISVLIQMACLILIGIAWRIWQPQGLCADDSRRVLVALVYHFLLPFLVLDVIWQAPLGVDSFKIVSVAASATLLCLLLAWLIFRKFKQSNATIGALILAASFPNATYLGLPVLEKTFGEAARSIAIQYDLFACTPILLSLGVLLARAYGQSNNDHPLIALLKVPPLWAAFIAMLLNLNGIAMPEWLHQWLNLSAVAVIPLMLIALGMGLQWTVLKQTSFIVIPAIILQLLIMPVIGLSTAQLVNIPAPLSTAVVLEAAMPSMVLGLALCDRYHLNAGLYSAVVTLSTVFSLLTIPLWFAGLSI